jgi:CO/xanthine dehydrogenase Mo-binding subunit
MVVTSKPRRQAAPVRDVEEWNDEPRVDAVAKVTGAAEYLDDLPTPKDTLHAAALRSPYSHARIISIDVTEALQLPGVRAILDRDHLYGLDPTIPIGEYLDEGEGPATGDQGLIATDKVRFDGDLVAMVAADDPATAEAATGLIRVEYEPLPAVYDYEAALAPDAPLVHDQLGSNIATQDSFEWGDVDEGFSAADHIFEETFAGGNAFHHPMEPATSCIIDYHGDQVDVWTSSHKPFLIRAQIAHVFDIPKENVRVRIPYIGGGFGAKQLTPAVIATVALSRETGRAVKYLASETESFRQTSRHSIEYRAKVGVKDDGTIVALDVFLAVDTGAYFTGAQLVTHNACISAWGCYRLPNYRVQAQTVYTNKVPAASFRATGKNQTTFGVECTLDAVARKLKLDPIDIRLKNVLKRGEYVADVWKVRGTEYPSDTPPMDTDYDDLMQRAVRAIGWDGRVDHSAAPSSVDGRIARGRGLALSLRHGAQGGGRAYAMASLDQDGSVTVSHNAPDLGTGVYTVLSVVAARSLGIPQEQVTVTEPDTSNNLPFGGTSAQRTTVQLGNALRAACEDLKKELLDAAVQVKGGEAQQWRVADGRAWLGDDSWSFAEILHAFRAASLRGVGSYSYAPSIDKAFGGLDHWAPGAAACEVEVDLDTGIVRVTRYAAIADAGKALHRVASEGQVGGGAMMGLSLALHEELEYSGLTLENGNAFDYRLALASDLPEQFVVEMVENGDGPGPFGAKGLSQTSLPCAAPAIGNAIRDAIGGWVRSYPFKPERVLAALQLTPPAGEEPTVAL